MKRKECKECPYINTNNHSVEWSKYVGKMESIGKIDGRHACHMITHDTWGYESEITDRNVCMGSLKRKNRLI